LRVTGVTPGTSTALTVNFAACRRRVREWLSGSPPRDASRDIDRERCGCIVLIRTAA
jgi:hypothetical protein